MTAILMPNGRHKYFATDGTPLAGGKVYTYEAGTNTPKTTWYDEAGTIPNTNPVILDAEGEAFIRWDGAYKVNITDSNDVPQPGWPVDNFKSDPYGVSGVPAQLAALITSFNAFVANVASSIGSSLMGFIQSGVGAVQRTVQAVLREQHSCMDFFNAAEATAEGMINRAITAHNKVYIPAGVYNIDTNIGIKVRTGTVLYGDGKNKTILSGVLGTGGSILELAAYAKGPIIKRDFNPAGPNAYVNDVHIHDIGLVLNHPDNAISTTIQIGFDMRNITGSHVHDCHVGNIPPVGGAVVKAYSKPFIVQGYPVVFGTVAGSDPAYAGGEKNRFNNNSVYGGYKCVIQDDTTLSPNSASYATVVRECDIQTGHWLIGQMGQYGAGNAHVDNILQDIQKQSGSVATSYMQYYDGYNNYVRPAYIEGGSNVDYQLYLDTDSNNNKIEMLMAGVTSGAGAITDNSNANSFNRISYVGLSGNGPLVELYNKAPIRQWVEFHWTGAAIVKDGESPPHNPAGTTVTRNGVGDYTITWGSIMPSAVYLPVISFNTDASSNMGGYTIVSKTANNVRIQCWIQGTVAANPPTTIDPRSVSVGAFQ